MRMYMNNFNKEQLVFHNFTACLLFFPIIAEGLKIQKALFDSITPLKCIAIKRL